MGGRLTSGGAGTGGGAKSAEADGHGDKGGAVLHQQREQWKTHRYPHAGEYTGPQEAGANLPMLLQSTFITGFKKYSALSVLDRETLNRLLVETLDPVYEDNLDIVRLGHITQTDYIMTVNIIKTSAGYVVSVHIANIQDGTINASYTETYTLEALENLTGVHKATATLLPALGVVLTDRATRELTGPATTRQ